MISDLLPHIEAELRNQIARLDQPRTRIFHEMLTYHMGWTGDGAGPEATGKRIRPLLVLLSTAACSPEWLRAVPAAAAVELVHNFSLLHDDIQDNSPKRRGRQTVWVKWGVPMAINAGDAMFVISNLAIVDLAREYSGDVVVKAAHILHNTCLDLTRGQFLDIAYEERNDLTIDDYWPMIAGKTSALVSACTRIGALLGNVDDEKEEAYRLFGYHLGLAFQVQDDILGIWGNEALTGKSTASDLVEGKNSFPVLYALGKKGKFADRWSQGPITAGEVNAVSKVLEAEGAKAYAEKIAGEETQKALHNLEKASPSGMAGEALFELANKLLKRKQ